MKLVQKTPLRSAFGCLLVLATTMLPALASSSRDVDGGGSASAGDGAIMDTGNGVDPNTHPSFRFQAAPFTTRNLETVPCGGVVATFPQETISKDFDTYIDATVTDVLTAVGLKYLFANDKIYGVQVMKVCASCESVVGEGAGAGAQDLYENPSFDHYCGENAYGHDLEHSGLVFLPLVGNDVRPGTMPGYVYSRATKAGKYERGPSLDLDTHLDYAFGIIATMAMGSISFAPDFMGYGAETTAEKGFLLRDTYLTSSIPLWLWVSNFVAESTDSRSALGDAAFYIGASEGAYASVALAEGFRAALGVVPVNTFASAGPYRLGSAAILKTIINPVAGGDVETYGYIGILLGEVYSSTNPNAANFGQGQDLLHDENRELALSWLNDPDLSKLEMNAKLIDFDADDEYRIENLWNLKIVQFLRDAVEAGVEDPCDPDYEGYVVGENDKFCEALKQNDLIDVLENANYNIELCYSDEDTVATPDNMPDVSVNTFLTATLKTGDHEEAIGACFFDAFSDIVSSPVFRDFVPEPKHKCNPAPCDSGPTTTITNAPTMSRVARGGTSSSARKSSLSFMSTALLIIVGLSSFMALCP